ncbi:hypothetical protein DXG01_009319 [Tephrocybe rancida]|nr:hypothetical protein DXG01_009319 [Tephrocybe rancida]
MDSTRRYPISVLIRQLRDFDDPNIPVVRTWEVKLEHDLTLDTSKLSPNKPDEAYYSRASDGEFYLVNLNGLSIVKPSYLEYYLEDMPGIALPVLLLMSYADYNAKRQRRVNIFSFVSIEHLILS